MKCSFLAAIVLFAAPVFAQNPTKPVAPAKPKVERSLPQIPEPLPFGQGITAADMKVLIDTLASPTFEGRETGEPGQRLAADYIAAQFKAIGLPQVSDDKTYFQKIFLQNDSWTTLSLNIEGRDFKNRTDFYVFAANCPDVQNVNLKELMFVGYGIEDPKYNDYGKADVQGKAVVFYDGEPMTKEGQSLITGSLRRSSWSLDWRKKVQLAQQKGATAVFIVDPKLAENVQKNRRLLSSWGWQPMSVERGRFAAQKETIPHMFISPETFDALCGGKSKKVAEALDNLQSGEKFKAVKIKTKVEAHFDKDSKTLEGSNVIGFIEGTDERLKKEFVFVTAHYDHLGAADSTHIYYGADDNASGTAAVIEIARAMAEAKAKGVGPKRSVVCMLVSGEEKGLLGSKFYTEFPVFPLDKTVADINIDMIGRLDKEHANNPDYIYVIGGDRTSRELHAITEEMNGLYTNLELDYKYNEPNEPNNYFGRSDHFNFVMKGIPATFFFNGTHADYHKMTDTRDKINFAAAAKRAQLAFYTAWEVANRDWRLSVDFSPENFKK